MGAAWVWHATSAVTCSVGVLDSSWGGCGRDWDKERWGRVEFTEARDVCVHVEDSYKAYDCL